MAIYMTADSGKILGPVAQLLGWIMDKIYSFLANVCGIENVALVIFILTIVIYLCLFPVTYRTQKFSMLTRKMQPELNAIRKKYEGKRDNASMMAMNEETQMVYDKYGISPAGSCVFMLIQMPILFALYRVFYRIPAYVGSVKGIFTELVDKIVATDGYTEAMKKIFEEAKLAGVKVDFTGAGDAVEKNYIVDVLYKLSDGGWNSVSDAFPSLSDLVATTHEKLDSVNNFLMFSISDTPFNLIMVNWKAGAFLPVFMAVMIPICAYLSQVLNLKMAPTPDNGGNDQAAQQMKMMNRMMPLTSLVFSFTVPVGLSLYWIAGALVRTVQQVVLNRHFEKIDLDAIIEKNKEKAKEKAEKRGIRREQMMAAAATNTKYRSLSSKAGVSADKQEALDRAEAQRRSAPKGSMASKANKVAEYNSKKKS